MRRDDKSHARQRMRCRVYEVGATMLGMLIALHIVACFVLVAVILLQAGRGGGGLAEAFGGGAAQQVFGTRTTAFLMRATSVCAVLYLVTCLGLTIVMNRRGQSLMRGAPLDAATPPAAAGTPGVDGGPAPATPAGVEDAPAGEGAASSEGGDAPPAAPSSP